jgi:YbbR domain-containing protein
MAWHPFRNFGLKVAALALGAVLWFMVSGEQVDRVVQVPLAFRNVPSGLTLLERPGTVDVQIRGGATEIMGLQPTDLSVIADLAGREPGEAVILLGVDRVTAPFGVEVTQITPSTVTVTLEPESTISVPVEIRWQGQPASGFVIGGWSVQPETVEVTGPSSRLRSPVVAVTEPVRVGGATADVVHRVGVGVTDPDVRLARPTTVQVTVRVESASPARVIDGRPVQFRNLAPGREATVEPAVVAVVIRSRLGSAAGFDVDQVRPYVDLNEAGPGPHDLAVQVDLPMGHTLVRVQPATVRVVVR